jgi:cytochrome b561
MTTQSITAEPEPTSTSGSSTAVKTKRFHPALVALHWLTAILIFGAFFLAQENEGGEISGGTSSTIGIHMIFGLSVLVLLIVRLIVRWTTKHPDWASTGNKFFDWVGNLTHIGLYLLTFGMTITGIILADHRGILARTFGIGYTPAPGSFGRGSFSIGNFHGAIWALLSLLILLHLGAALYHQFFIKDDLLSRMWFGKRDS